MPKVHKMLSIELGLLEKFNNHCQNSGVKFSHEITRLIEQCLNSNKLPEVSPKKQAKHEKWLAKKRAHRAHLIATHGEKKALRILMQEAGLEPLE